MTETQPQLHVLCVTRFLYADAALFQVLWWRVEAGYEFLRIELFRQLEHHRVLRHESLFVTFAVQTVTRGLSIRIFD